MIRVKDDYILVDKIEQAALDPNMAMSNTMRLCISLGSQPSRALCEWVENELKGLQARY